MIPLPRFIHLVLIAYVFAAAVGCRCPYPSSRTSMAPDRIGEPVVMAGDDVTQSLVGNGFLVANINAKAPLAQGTLAVDIRKPGGGSLRSGRVSVSSENGVFHNSLTLPIREGEDLRSFIEDVPPGGVAPETSLSIYYFE